MLDTVKLAEREDALVLRLYEAHGAAAERAVELGVPAASVSRANLLEDPEDGLALAGTVVESTTGRSRSSRCSCGDGVASGP